MNQDEIESALKRLRAQLNDASQRDLDLLVVELQSREKRIGELEKNLKTMSHQILELNQEIENVRMDFGEGNR